MSHRERDTNRRGRRRGPRPAGHGCAMTTISETAHHRAGRSDERALLRAAQAHDGAGRDELVEAYMPLIGSVAHRYHGARAVTHSELMQAGVVGLLRAVDL